MADPLYELLASYFESPQNPRQLPSPSDPVTSNYLTRLSTLPLASLTSTEPQSLSQSSNSLLISLQALSTRSHKSVIASSERLSTLRTALPTIAAEASRLQDAIPSLDDETVRFSQKYSKSGDNLLLERRRKAMLVARNIDRLSDVLDLPTLLSSAISSSSGPTTSVGGSSGGSSVHTTSNYGSALDLHAHIKRLHTLYPHSRLIESISTQAEGAMRVMTTNLIASLRTQGFKLAGGMRTIGWLRRVAPELDENWSRGKRLNMGGNEGSLGALFLVCRLSNLVSMLEALGPLRELADQETEKRMQNTGKREGAQTNGAVWSGGQQTERYLKRYIEIFREQSFAIISMYKSIFPSSSLGPGSTPDTQRLSSSLKTPAFKSSTINGIAAPKPLEEDPFYPLPSALSTFPLHLVDLLTDTLRKFLPNVQDRGSRESLLTQVLYCAGSLGRLGGDFSMILASLNDPDDDSEDGAGDDEAAREESDGVTHDENENEEWVEVMKKHRQLAGRLELLASGVGGGSTTSLREASSST
ncbi:MAG: hypothetical protein M1827_005260 [Pycnora praestabilis]|nr:MAG: hypothetical protein M1827_005260 [Pycnora praestabilis]